MRVQGETACRSVTNFGLMALSECCESGVPLGFGRREVGGEKVGRGVVVEGLVFGFVGMNC